MSLLSAIESDVAKLAPIALNVIASIESSIKTTAGATKKAIAVTMIGNLAKTVEGSGNATATGIAELVDTIVGVLNATGLFGHSSTPPTTT